LRARATALSAAVADGGWRWAQEDLARRRRSLAFALPVAGPVVLLAGVLAVVAKQLVQTDTWVALVAGREIARHGLPSVERLTLIAHGRTWVDQQWLAQLILYEIERIGGVGLVVGVCAGLALLAFALAAAAALSRGASPGWLLVWVIAGFAAGPWGAEARTQSLALPLFALVCWLIVRDPDLRKPASLAALPVLCLWANIHGSVALGALLLCAHAGQALVRTGLRRLPVALLLLAPVTLLASPYATGLPGYYRTMLLHPPYGHELREWQRTTPAAAPVFFAVAVLAAVVLVVRRRRAAPVDWVVLAVTFGAALTAIRITPWFGLALVAVMPALTPARSAAADFARPAATLTAAVLAAGSIGVLAWIAAGSYDGPPAIITALAHEPRRARVVADLPLADWVLWEAPQLRGRVAYDGRPELMTRKEFQDDVVRFARLSPGWPATLQGYTLVVTNPAIARRISRPPSRWTITRDAGGIVLLRRKGAG
jgi:hypothetical protein